MSQTLITMRVAPRIDLPGLLAGLVRNIARWTLLAIGGFLVVLGVLMAPLPGPLGLPVTLAGLIILLRNSFRARRWFIEFQHKYPRIIYPMRRLLRRDPQVVSLAYQQAMRIERLVIPSDWRFLKGVRRRYFRRRRAQAQ